MSATSLMRQLPILFVLAIGLSGCQSMRAARIEPGSREAAALTVLREVDEEIDSSLTRGGNVEFLKSRPHLALDSVLRHEIRDLLEVADAPGDDDIRAIVARATSLALENRGLRLQGIEHQEQQKLIALAMQSDAQRVRSQQFASANSSAATTWLGTNFTASGIDSLETVNRTVEMANNILIRNELEGLLKLQTSRSRRSYLKGLLSDARPSIKQRGRWLRQLACAPISPFVHGWIGYFILTEHRGSYDVDWNQYYRFEPDTSGDADTRAHLESAGDEELAAFYLPRIVQQVDPEANYDPTINRPGRVHLEMQTSSTPVVYIDTDDPSIYYHFSFANLGVRRYRQIVYTLWYPNHPKLKRNDPEAGRIDGQVIRITLDAENRPLVYETVYSCGCFHRIWPTARLEDAADEAWRSPMAGHRYALGKTVRRRIDGIIPELAGEFEVSDPHPTLWIFAGYHMIGKVGTGSPEGLMSASEAIRAYPYDELEALPFGARRASMFGSDGLVRGADRPESIMLYPSGIYHAGTPRQRGTHMIHFDQYDFDDPSLLETLLRWPTPKLEKPREAHVEAAWKY